MRLKFTTAPDNATNIVAAYHYGSDKKVFSKTLAYSPVIFLTGTVDVATKVRAFDAGAADYVTKPFDAVELRAARSAVSL